MQIQWKNIIPVVVVLFLIVVVALYKFGVLDRFTGGTSDNTNTSQPYSTSGNQPTTNQPVVINQAQTVNTVDNSSTVGITAPPEPVSGKIRSVSMIGPSGGFNAITKTDGKSYKLLKKNFVPMLINEGAVSTDDIKKVLQQFINDSWNNGVSSNGDIQIVVASSVANNPKVQAALPELKKTYVVTVTTSETEAAGAFKVAVASQYVNSAFTMDISPTITRFAYQNGGKIVGLVANTGSKYYQNNQTDEQALAEIRRVVAQIPVSNRQICLVLWGAAEKDLRQGQNRYSVIPNYTGSERSTISGLKLINEVKLSTNANTILDFESLWYQAF